MSSLSPVNPDPEAPPVAPEPFIPRDRPFSARNLIQTIAGGYLPLLLATLVVFLPLLWMILSSFKLPGEIITMDLKILPASLDPQNYNIAMTTVPFAQFFINSTIVTVVGSTIKVLLAILTAYALVFVRFPFRNAIFILILVALMVPPQVSILPNYILIAGMGGKNTLWGI
ncbi:MAG: carbohydrate ABC transporter permease, partial [Cellulosimicrobium cellulans]